MKTISTLKSMGLLGLLLMLALTNSASAGTVAWWRFNDGSPTPAVLTNSGTGGSVFNATAVAGSSEVTNVAGAYINDGFGSYYTNTSSYAQGTNTADGSALGLTASTNFATYFASGKSWTLEALAYLTNTSPFASFLGNETNVFFGAATGGRLRFYGFPGDGGAGGQILSADATTLNTWHHVAAVGTWDAINSRTIVNLYVNGVSKGTRNFTNGLMVSLTDPFSIGAPSKINGYLDELRFSDTALSTTNFLSASPIPESGVSALLLVGLLTVGLTLLRKRTRTS